MLEKWKKCASKGNVLVVFFKDFSKAFDFLDHKLLTAKLNAHSCNPPASCLIHECFSNRKQRIEIENTYIS